METLRIIQLCIKMFAARSEAYNLDRTCRCCLRDMSRMVSLDKVDYNIDNKAVKPMTFGEKLMEIASIQVCCYCANESFH